MSTIILGNIGNIAGAGIGGPLGAAIGGVLGSALGSTLDNKIFGSDSKIAGARLSDLSVQSSAYSKMIPIVYGKNRIAGNIIWSLPIQENIRKLSDNNLSKLGIVNNSEDVSYYVYTVTVAIALCEGEIDELLRIWANTKILNFDSLTFRFYKGTEDQMPDPLIEATEGIGKAPAYRGLAYVVIEDFPLSEYGNHIPNFTFEVRKNIKDPFLDIDLLENMITAINIIPGSGEFVYDTVVQSKIYGEEVNGKLIQSGYRNYININNFYGKADSVVSLDQLQKTLPNIEWVSVIVVWFIDNLDAGDAVIKPGVEYQDMSATYPDEWGVSEFNRFTARKITLDENNIILYGGTPSDSSLINYLKEIKERGLKISLNPMIFVDILGKPWRGEVTSEASHISNFFTKKRGYNEFIEFYANLAKDYVDIFIIGSELKGLTSVKDVNNNFPAVDCLVNLASRVKNILNSETKVSYAADWSEYHHTEGGWYNLDPLWASDSIDFVGIDSYFPLKDEEGMDYNVEKIMKGWESGEGYEWVYINSERTEKEETEPRFAWKNIRYWWENKHVNPDGNETPWIPGSKKICFMEYGFPSVDGAANEPNIFYSLDSEGSGFPRFSKGNVDFEAQRTALFATEKYWRNSDMIEQKFVWCWDARPFPFWPDLKNIWADSDVWKTGHWIQGKLGRSSVAAVIRDLSKRVSFLDDQLDLSLITKLLDGYVINRQISARGAINELRNAFFFDAVESGKKMKYVPRGSDTKIDVTEKELLPVLKNNSRDVLETVFQQEAEMPKKVDVAYINHASEYEVGNQHSQRQITSAVGLKTISLPIVMTDYQAKNIADIFLYKTWMERVEFYFFLSTKYFYIEPTDVICLILDTGQYLMRVISTQYSSGMLKISAVAEDVSIYNFDKIYSGASITQDINIPGKTSFELLDLPYLLFENRDEYVLRLAVSGLDKGWKGCSLFMSNYSDRDYTIIRSVNVSSVTGSVLNVLQSGPSCVFDYYNSLTVSLLGNHTLESFEEIEVLNGANFALVGDEIIQFKNVELLEPNKYILKGLLRGRMGTEISMENHYAGERFILLDDNIFKQKVTLDLLGLKKYYKVVTGGTSLDEADEKEFTYLAKALKPYSPVHSKAVYDEDKNISLSWIRRARKDAQWRDYFDVLLDETSEKYEIDIIKDNLVVRTLYSESEKILYETNLQIKDFGTIQDRIEAKIYQISDVVGRGSPCSVSISLR